MIFSCFCLVSDINNLGYYDKISNIYFPERYRRSNHKREPPIRPPPATNNVSQTNNRHDDTTVTLRNPQTKPFPQPAPPQPMPTMGFPTGGGGSARAARRGQRKLTKADISMPSGFKHVTHVGWSPHSGFDLTGEENDALQPFLQKAGVSDQQLKDRETRAFIYDFIQNHKVLESVKSDNNPPPVPTRSQNSNSSTGQRQAPPPPPIRQQAPPPLPKTTPPSRAPAPSRPPPIVTTPNRTSPPQGNTAAPAVSFYFIYFLNLIMEKKLN
jgi:neural Wiskott-Aldrich syndrome protein